MHPDGTATLSVGTSGHGQGHATSFSMIVSDRLGIPMEAIVLVTVVRTLLRLRHTESGLLASEERFKAIVNQAHNEGRAQAMGALGQAALAAASGAADCAGQAAAQLSLGDLYLALTRYDTAVAHYTAAALVTTAWRLPSQGRDEKPRAAYRRDRAARPVGEGGGLARRIRASR